MAIISRPVLVPVSAHGSARKTELRPGVYDALDDLDRAALQT
jgi:hypothetical protein